MNEFDNFYQMLLFLNSYVLTWLYQGFMLWAFGCVYGWYNFQNYL